MAYEPIPANETGEPVVGAQSPAAQAPVAQFAVQAQAPVQVPLHQYAQPDGGLPPAYAPMYAQPPMGYAQPPMGHYVTQPMYAQPVQYLNQNSQPLNFFPQPQVAGQQVFAAVAVQPMHLAPKVEDIPLTAKQQLERKRMRWVGTFLIVFSVLSMASTLHMMTMAIDSILGIVTGSLVLHWSCYQYNANKLNTSRYECCGFGHVFGLALSTVITCILLNVIRCGLIFIPYFDVEPVATFFISMPCSLAVGVLAAYISSTTSPTSCCVCFTRFDRRLRISSTPPPYPGPRPWGRACCCLATFIFAAAIVAMLAYAAVNNDYGFIRTRSYYYYGYDSEYYYSYPTYSYNYGGYSP